MAHPQPPAPLRARDLGFWLLSQPYVVWVWRRSGHHPSVEHHPTTPRCGSNTQPPSVIIWRGLILHHTSSTHKFTSWWSVRPTGRCPMGRNATKTPRSQAAAASPEPDAEAAVAPASEVPEATAEATEEQPGDDDLGGDSGAAAASSPAPEAARWARRMSRPRRTQAGPWPPRQPKRWRQGSFAAPPRAERRGSSTRREAHDDRREEMKRKRKRKRTRKQLPSPVASPRARARQRQRQRCRAAPVLARPEPEERGERVGPARKRRRGRTRTTRPRRRRRRRGC